MGGKLVVPVSVPVSIVVDPSEIMNVRYYCSALWLGRGDHQKGDVVALDRSGVLARERAQILVGVDVADRERIALEAGDILKVERHGGGDIGRVEHGDGGLLALPVERLVEGLRDRGGVDLLVHVAGAGRVGGAGLNVRVGEPEPLKKNQNGGQPNVHCGRKIVFTGSPYPGYTRK